MKRHSLPFLFFMISSCHLIAQTSENIGVRIARFRDNKQAAISFTFDDGLREHYTLVAPELEKMGIHGTFWVNGKTINRNEPVITDTTRTTWAELKELSDRGHEISNHGWSHSNLTKLDDEGVMEEISKNDSIINARIGLKPVTYCYAGNSKNERVIRLASASRTGTRTFQRSIGSKSTPGDLENWVNELIRKQEWGVGMTHGITYGYDAFRNPQILWNFLDYVRSLHSKVWTGTFREVSAYVAERDSTRLKMDIHENLLKITPCHSLNRKLFNQPLTMVVSTAGRVVKSVKQGSSEIVFRQSSPTEVVFDFDISGGIIIIKLSKI